MSNDPCAILPGGWPVPRGYANGTLAYNACWSPSVLSAGMRLAFRRRLFGSAPPDADQYQGGRVWRGGRIEDIVRLTWHVTELETYRASLLEMGPAPSPGARPAFSAHGAGAGGRAGRAAAGADHGDRGHGAVISPVLRAAFAFPQPFIPRSSEASFPPRCSGACAVPSFETRWTAPGMRRED